MFAGRKVRRLLVCGIVGNESSVLGKSISEEVRDEGVVSETV